MNLFKADSWERTRNRGRKRFVIRLVAIYVAAAFLLSVFSYWRMTASGLFDLLPGFRAEAIWLSIVLILVGAPLFGWIWALLTWQLMEAMYRRLRGRTAGA